jgi:pilus assembly protein CpaB
MPFRRRWSPRSKLFAALSVLSGAAAFLLVHGYAARLEALRPLAGAPVPVVVAARSLPRGTVLSEDLLRVRSLPSAYAPPGAIGSREQAEGRTLVSDLAEGEAVTETRVGVEGGAVASLVPSGLRAFPLRAGVPPGAVRPGDRVDVLATFGGPRPYTDTVASGLEVLAILEADEGTFTAGGDGPSLVLLVSPDTAERLAYAVAFGRLSITVGSADEPA